MVGHAVSPLERCAPLRDPHPARLTTGVRHAILVVDRLRTHCGRHLRSDGLSHRKRPHHRQPLRERRRDCRRTGHCAWPGCRGDADSTHAARDSRPSGLRRLSSSTTRWLTALATDPPDSPARFDRADAAGCPCPLRAKVRSVTTSVNTDVPDGYPNIKLRPAREQQQLDIWENEGGASTPVSSTRSPSWRSNRLVSTSYRSPGAAPI